jgi:hypothetical protein
MASVDVSSQSDDFTLEPGKTLLIALMPFGGSFFEVFEKLSEDPTVQLVQKESSLEAVNLARKVPCCLILFHGSEPQDITNQINMLKLLREDTENEKVRCIMTTFVNDVSILSQLSFHGCTEIIREPVTGKSLLFKLQRHLKGLTAFGQKEKAPAIKKEAVLPAAAKKDGGSDAAVFKLIEPLDFESDFWFLPLAPPKKVSGRWIVLLHGPDPTVGDWVKRGTPGEWAWKPTNLEKHPYIQEEGQWVFRGKKPDFVKGAWSFTAAEPLLAFYQGKVLQGAKIKTDEKGVLILTKNSPAAIMAFADFATAVAAPVIEAAPPKNEEKNHPPLNWEPVYRFVAPLTLSSDYWLCGDKIPQWIAGRWSTKITGPDHTLGEWIEVSGDKDRRWQWIMNDPVNMPSPGVWEFVGSKPVFERGDWIFVSKKPELGFHVDGRTTGFKIASEEGNSIVLTWDSETAKKNLESYRVKVLSRQTEAEKKEAADQEVRMETSHFGMPPGRWEFVTKSLSGEHTFVYIPYEVVNRLLSAPDIQKLPRYFYYDGKEAPALLISDLKEEWIFQNNAPEGKTRFSALSKKMQEHLKEKYTVLEERIRKAAEGEVDSPEVAPPKDEDLELETAKTKLNPLILGLFASEMMIRASTSKKQMLQSFCTYLNASFKEVRAELWVLRQDQWFCPITVDGAPELYQKSVPGLDLFPRVNEDGTVVSPILRKRGDQEQVIGALVFGGPGAVTVSVDLAKAYSLMATGLIIPFAA